GSFHFVFRQHDGGTKRVLGRTGAFSGEDILKIVLEQSQLAIHLTEKLWREFISETPDPHEVERIAAVFRRSGYRIAPWLQALLMSPHFWTQENRGVLTKSPVDLAVGTIRTFNLPMKDTTILARYGRRLGQDLFDPPNVKGWPGGTRWITTTTLLARWQWLQRSLRGHELGGHLHPDIQAMGQRGGSTWTTTEPVEVLQSVLLPIPPVNSMAVGDDRWKIVQQLVLDPAYQLK
ncbi:MAG TPA: DUF1800 family protein, partial [Nitrospiraceae bacterium]|nr:DUF1800 family protein [Nitrospiraceae bacterium]